MNLISRIKILSPYKKIAFDNGVSPYRDLILESFNNFKFFKDDIIFTTGGLSFSEAAYSGLKTVNIFLNEKSKQVCDESLLTLANVINLGQLKEIENYDDDECLHIEDRIKKARVEKYRKCDGIQNVIKLIDQIVI